MATFPATPDNNPETNPFRGMKYAALEKKMHEVYHVAKFANFLTEKVKEKEDKLKKATEKLATTEEKLETAFRERLWIHYARALI